MKHLRFVFTILALVLFSKPSFAKIELDWGAFVEADIRMAFGSRVDQPRLIWNRATLGADLVVDLVPNRLRFVGDLQFTWTGFSEDTDFAGLTQRANVSPWFIESTAVYVEALDILPGLDLRVGRQIVQWGAADMFNPTNNLNSLNLEDPLKFGEVRANQMIRLDWGIGDNFIFTGVWVPVFEPALLPELDLSNAIVELDIAITEQRGFAGLVFRLQDKANFEHFYIRPHQSGNPDANQYTPVFNGVSAWQLYHGEEYASPTPYKFNEWMSVKIIFSGSKASP